MKKGGRVALIMWRKKFLGEVKMITNEMKNPLVTINQSSSEIETARGFDYGPVPIAEDVYPVKRLLPMEMAGISFQQAQKLNSKWLEAQVEFQKLITVKNIELNYEHAKVMLHHELTCNQGSVIPVVPAGTSNNDIGDLVENFIATYKAVKDRAAGSTWRFYLRNEEDNRHEQCSETEIKNEFRFFCELNRAEDMRNAEFEAACRLLRNSIPTLEKSKLHVINGKEVVFRNGVFSLDTAEFSDIPNIFNLFSIDADFSPNYREPLAFEAFLDDIFAGNDELKKLTFQIIGALLSPTATLKKMFVFQGVSNAGKTRLAEKIIELVGDLDCESYTTLSDVTNDSVVNSTRSKRLLYFRDAADKKISPKQAAYIKGFADGGSTRFAALFKILLCTNHALYTADDGSVETPLKNRLLVLPFAKAMDNSDERVSCFEELYFENEREAIICKALQAFSEVVRNGGKFCVETEVNAVIETPKTAQNQAKSFGDVLFEHFELAEKPITPAGEVFEILTSVAPDFVKSKQQMGKMIAGIDAVKHARTAKDVLYNLVPKGAKSDE